MADELLDKLKPLLGGLFDASGNLNVASLNMGTIVPLLIEQLGTKKASPSQRPMLTPISPQATLLYYQMHSRQLLPDLVKDALDQVLSEPPPPMDGTLSEEVYQGYNQRFEVKDRAMDTIASLIQGALERRRQPLMNAQPGDTGLRLYVRYAGSLAADVVKEAIDLYAHLRPGAAPEDGGEFMALKDDFLNLLVPQIQSLHWRKQQAALPK